MRYKSCNCVHCDSIFTETSDVVVCPLCGSPHHRECWKQTGKCANEEKHGENFEWIYPEHLREKKEAKKPAAKSTTYKFRNGENVVICPHCNTLNYANDALCLKCRNPLHNDIGAPEMPETGIPAGASRENFSDANNFNRQEEEFIFYQRFGGLRPDTLVSGIPAAELAQYIGENKSGIYIRRFAAAERFGKKLSFSICAFIFGPLWFLYRKMYKEGLIYIVISLILGLTAGICALTQPAKDMYSEAAVLYEQLYNEEISVSEFNEALTALEEKYKNVVPSEEDSLKVAGGYIVTAASFAMLIGMSLFANHLYLKKIKKDVLAIREECTDMPGYMRTLRERGGVSVGGAIIGIIGHLLVYILQLLPSYLILFGVM